MDWTRELVGARVNPMVEVVMNGDVTTKDLEVQQKDVASIGVDIRAEGVTFCTEIRAEFAKLTLRIGLMLAASSAVIITVLEFFK